MSEVKKDEVKKPTYEEILAALNDPTLLHAAAAKFGLKVQGVEKKEEKKKPELPTFELPEDTSDMPGLIKALNKSLGGFAEYVKQSIDSSKEEVTQEVVKNKQEQQANTVREFAKAHPDFNDLIPFIEPYFNSGKSIEEAYTLGKRASGKGEPENKGKKKIEDSGEKSDEARPRLSKISENDDTDVNKAKPKSVRDSVKKNLDILLKDIPDSEDVIQESDEL